MNPRNVLILPGWQNSGPDHWQSRWERMHGYTRIEQHDWQRPLRGDWMSRVEEVLLSCDEPAVLVGHSLGCVAIAAWASHSKNTGRVKAALLVAPPDTEREDICRTLPSWSPLPLQVLPFRTLAMVSADDPFCDAVRAQHFANSWHAQFIDAGAHGHLNSESALGDWPDAHDRLLQLMAIRLAAT